MMQNNGNREIAIRLTGVKKKYKLGQIGGGTLQADLQSWWARRNGKEDPNSKIGQENRLDGSTFMALNGVDLTVYKGEALGIIGGNGAGKSTTLKLISRVTAPTTGKIEIWGRVASMLEVGTGFNGEMTGRENVYLNGAILGMTKAEIDAKMEQIIEFSEVREFIDTPVKRYSSGMYVKLAFSVAAHLDSEIMIMDEVLAVGDIAFQKKCLGKMKDAAKQEGRTVLYVSHNMNTIRELCDRCVVLDKGKVIYDGAVERAIEVYSNTGADALYPTIDLDERQRPNKELGKDVRCTRIRFDNNEECKLRMGEKLQYTFMMFSKENYQDVCFRFMLYFADDTPICMAGTKTGDISVVQGDNSFRGTLDTGNLAPGRYYLKIAVYRINEFGVEEQLDVLNKTLYFVIVESDVLNGMNWLSKYWGHSFAELTVKSTLEQ